MNAVTTDRGPVSAHLEAELRELARQRGIVIFLDKEGAYSEFASGLRQRADAGLFPFPVRAFRGSFLELLLELDGLEDGASMKPLVVHVPGYNSAEIRKTPVLELYAAGKQHQRALATLIKEAAHGAATVAEIDALLARPGLTLEDADAWLAARSRAGQGGEDGPDLSTYSAEAIFDDLFCGRDLAGRFAEPKVARAVWRRAERLLGVSESFRGRFAAEGSVPPGPAAPFEAASNAAAQLARWVMCVEFVHDLHRAPKEALLQALTGLPKPIVQACQRLAGHVRERYPQDYARLADQAEDLIPTEAEQATAEDLGEIDTFRFEEQKVLAAALRALERADYAAAHAYAVARIEGRSFWVREKVERRRAWELVQMAAELGLAATEHADLLQGARTHEDAIERYARRGFRVDAAQRKLEQARQQASVLEIDEFQALRQRLDEARAVYRRWADAQTQAWNALCAAHGFLPGPSLRQRELFEDVVRPWALEEGVTAYFMVDALRYEMGEQLYQVLAQSSRPAVNLSARLAELPTVTEVGMNVLAPLSDAGKLRPEIRDGRIAGFRSREARVATPDERRKTMHERVGGRTCPRFSLQELNGLDVTTLRKKIAEARLVVVHSEGIDKAGEKGVGLSVFENELRELRAGYRLLQEAGVRRFVFTADHGFLLHDPVTRAPRLHGNKVAPDRRHVISDARLEQDGEVCVSAADLGYESDPVYFLFPADAAPFDLGSRAKDFVHGGNSLQERVIPVLTVAHKAPPGAEAVHYRIEAELGKSVARMHCVKARVTATSQRGLAFGSAAQVELVLECMDSDRVRVELCDAHDAALASDVVQATIDQPFVLYFRLHGVEDRRVRVRLRHATSAKHVDPAELPARFQVDLSGESARKQAPAEQAVAGDESWLLALPAGGVRDVFRHIAAHGMINEADATRVLGGPRQFRKFSRELDQYVVLLPFAVRVDVSAGTKCYVRGGG